MILGREALDFQARSHVGAGAPTRPAVLRAAIGERSSPARTRASGPTYAFLYVVVLALSATLVPSAAAQQGPVVLTRDSSTIVLEPYAPNVLRVTLSLQKNQ